MPAAVLSRRLATERAAPASMALAAICGCALIALVDPNDGGRYPTCPTKALLGIDCPACGTLRGLHALSRGQVGRALDHNLLLLLAVPIGVVVWCRWVWGAVGRPVHPVHVPAWVLPASVLVAATFAVLRNLDIGTLTWLASAASADVIT
ncbi:MAG: DUF2752 domain-containing protein, partial [Acidimicrobiales bacterium]